MSSRRTSARRPGIASPLKGADTVQTLKQNEVALKTKVRSLELEVETLRCRLDSLRKAKNTTIIRREREEARTYSPKLGRKEIQTRPPSCHVSQVEKMQEEIAALNSELLSLKAAHENEILSLKGDFQKELKELKEGHKETIIHMFQARHVEMNMDEAAKIRIELEGVQTENYRLLEKLEEMITSNDKLREANAVLQTRCKTLLEDLSIKEAEWIEREEKLTKEIRTQWGQQYHVWIVKAEKKMEELQKINSMLQSMLKTKVDLDATN